MLPLKGLIVLVIFSLLSGYFTYIFSVKTDQLSDEVELTDRITNNPLDVVLNDLEGKAVVLKKWQSDLVVLNFWGTWCPPCRREIPLLVQLHKKYLNKGVFLVVSSAQGRFSSRHRPRTTVSWHGGRHRARPRLGRVGEERAE